MTTSRSPSKQRTTTTTRAGRRPAARRLEISVVRRTLAGEAGAKSDAAERKLQQIGRAAAKLARHSMKEMAVAADACRVPAKSIWRSVARASRNIARDAAVAWHEVTLPPQVGKQAAAGKGGRPAA
jgi:hypothetical protein